MNNYIVKIASTLHVSAKSKEEAIDMVREEIADDSDKGGATCEQIGRNAEVDDAFEA